MGVNELLLVKTKDENEAEAVEKAAEQRKKTQLDNFEGYGAEQVKLLDASIIKTKVHTCFLLFHQKLKL
mgnify:CR=1 FL=1